jgi:hypothetical protein
MPELIVVLPIRICSGRISILLVVFVEDLNKAVKTNRVKK